MRDSRQSKLLSKDQWRVVVRCMLWCGCLSTPHVIEAADHYATAIRPLFHQRCVACHGPLKQSGGLRLDTGAAALRGGDSGPAVVPHLSMKSALWARVTATDESRMPPPGEGAVLSRAELQTLQTWIEAGASIPAEETPAVDPRQFWSYQPVRRPPVPAVRGAGHPIDAFLEAARQKAGVTIAPPADRELWLRRVTIDLTGLPPTIAELDAYLQDAAPDADERVVDRLLNSPAYGERWGRHWMDVWRYSDWYGSRGINEIRYSQRHLWRWRDWIISSLNEDRGYDEMVRLMLAADELAAGDAHEVSATGFLGRNWYKFDRNVWMFDAVEHTAQAFLGTTLRCCRCHDHKYDPLTQADYYAFRAFFEPHDVRTDPVDGDRTTEKDATLGAVLKIGRPLVYDRQLAAPTYLFRRGDARFPDEGQPFVPGVPKAFGVPMEQIRPVSLPREQWFPTLAPTIVADLQRRANAAELTAQDRLRTALAHVKAAETALSERQAGKVVAEQPPLFRDDFAQARPEIWSVVGGDWNYADGRLTQAQPVTFPTFLSSVNHPQDFRVKLRYRTLSVGSIHSVGFFFDVHPLSDCQAVYTATDGTKATIQAFHRQQGREAYPAAGIANATIPLERDVTIEVAVRERRLNAWVDGTLALVYDLPVPRQTGTFALWTHAGGAAFDELIVDSLPDNFTLATAMTQRIPAPFQPITVEEQASAVAVAQTHAERASADVAIAKAESQALQATLAADVALAERIESAIPSAALVVHELHTARAALLAQRQLAVNQAERKMQETRDDLSRQTKAGANTETIKKSEQAFHAAEKQLAEARQQLTNSAGVYVPLGTPSPQTSTGRRTALAQWITDSRHPRTARVAVNHLWLRHMGEALVPTVANFGLNGQPPTHPELLDWLADEFVRQGWRMKPLHRLIVTSAAYRMSSDIPAEAAVNLEWDPSNRWYWRMHAPRLEAEAVRDAVLAVANRLDDRFGGPELAESQGETVLRRSLYFRNTPNEHMPFLELFDQANPNECYRRQDSVMPQQALALSNSLLTMGQAEFVAQAVLQDLDSVDRTSPQRIATAAFRRVLGRPPRGQEVAVATELLGLGGSAPGGPPSTTAIESLVHVLLNHHDFVTRR